MNPGRHLLSLVMLIAVFVSGVPTLAQRNRPIGENATAETKRLYKSLRKLSRKHTLFGHQHATEYGHGWAGEPDRSDVKSVTGSHPAVIGVDFSGFSGRSPESMERAKVELRKT